MSDEDENELMTDESEEIQSPDFGESTPTSSVGKKLVNNATFHLDEEKLLTPISGDNPAGESLRYEGTYDLIQKAREEEDDLPQGVWEREIKKADWNKVKDVCIEALENRSKDLQVAVWLTEALLHLYGFSGVREGLKLLMGLCEGFWDHLYPEIDEDDLESRVSPIVWMNEKLFLKLKLVQVTQPESVDTFPYTWADWETASNLENLALKDKNVLQDAESQGKVTRAKFLGSVMFTSKSFYAAQSESLHTSIDIAKELESFFDEKCGEQSPTLKRFRDSLEDIKRLMDDFFMEKQEEDEDHETPESEGDQQGFLTPQEEGKEAGKKTGIGSIRGRADAYRMLSAAADYLLIHEPHSPTPYLVKRAVSWGNMTLNELLYELVADDQDLQSIYKLLGIKGPMDV